MTDRIRTVTVLLDNDYRVGDDAEVIIQAIRMIKGVESVTPGEVVNMVDWTARHVVHQRVQEKLFKLLDELKSGE